MPLSAEQRDQISLQSPKHLKRFLLQHNRRYIIIDAIQLVDALEKGLGWPMGARWFQALAQYLREWRMTRCPPVEEPCLRCGGAPPQRFDQSAPACSACSGAGKTQRALSDALEPDELRAVRAWITEQLGE